MLETKTPLPTNVQVERGRLQAVLDETVVPDARTTSRARPRRIMVVLLVMMIALLVGVIFNLNVAYRTQLQALQDKAGSITRSWTTTQAALKENVRKNRTYRFALTQEKDRSMILAGEVTTLSSQLRVLSNELGAKREQAASLETELEVLKNENSAVKQDLTQLNEWVVSLQRVQDNLQRKVRRLLTRSKVELGTLVVKPAHLNGKVLKANSKYNFIIMDLGRNDGVGVGMTLTARRNDAVIGDIKVEKVYDELSVGKALFPWASDEVVVGDSVKGKE